MQFLHGFAAQYVEHLLWSIVRDHLKLQVRLSSFYLSIFKILFKEHKDLERQEFFAKKTWKCNILAYVLGLAGVIIMIVMLVQMSSTTVYYCTNYTGLC